MNNFNFEDINFFKFFEEAKFLSLYKLYFDLYGKFFFIFNKTFITLTFKIIILISISPVNYFFLKKLSPMDSNSQTNDLERN